MGRPRPEGTAGTDVESETHTHAHVICELYMRYIISNIYNLPLTSPTGGVVCVCMTSSTLGSVPDTWAF